MKGWNSGFAGVAYPVCAYALAIALYACWHSWRGYRFSNPLFYSLAVLEIALLAITVSSVIAFRGRDHEVDGVLFFSYLATTVIVPPVAVGWGIVERSRWGTGVVAIAMLTVSALMLRLLGIWESDGSVI